MQINAHAGTVTLRLGKGSEEDQIMKGLASSDILHTLQGRVSLLCRPDDVCLYQDTRSFDHSNVLKGTVSYSSFVGGRWHTLVKPEKEEQIPPILAYSPFQPQLNQQVWIEFPPESCQIVQE
jgi:hypothetical protein